MGGDQDGWIQDALGISVPDFYDALGSAALNDTGKGAGGGEPGGGETAPSGEPQHRFHPGIFDRAFGLNPDRSFTEAAMEPFFGKPGDPGFLQIHEGDGDGMKLARAAGIVVLLPIWGVGAVGGAVLDHANQIVNDFGEIGTGIQNAPTSPNEATAPGQGGGNTANALQADPGSVPDAPQNVEPTFEGVTQGISGAIGGMFE